MIVRKAAAAIALLIWELSAGCAPSQIVNSWKSPALSGPGFTRVLVIGMAAWPDVRRPYEDALVRDLRARGLPAVAGYTLLPDDRMADDEAIRQAAVRSGADALLVTRLVKVELRPVIVPPEPGVRSRIDSAWPGTYKPQVAGQNEIVTLETRLLQASTGQLAWSGTTETFDAADLQKAIPSTSRAIVKELARQGLI